MSKILPGIIGISGKIDDHHALINGKKIKPHVRRLPEKKERPHLKRFNGRTAFLNSISSGISGR